MPEKARDAKGNHGRMKHILMAQPRNTMEQREHWQLSNAVRAAASATDVGRSQLIICV
jgi:hypothetical protein